MFTGQQVFALVMFFSFVSVISGMGLTYSTLVKKCEHDYEKISETSCMIIYRCKKCGKVQKIPIV